MSQVVERPMGQPVFPRGILIGVGALLLFSIVVAGTARLTNNNHVEMPPTYPVASRDLAFKDLANGGVEITDAKTGVLVSSIAPQSGAFVRGIMRGLVRGHRIAELAPGSAFRLTRWADGRLSIEDPATHERFELEAFGSTNEKVFAQFLEGAGAKRQADAR